MTEHLPGHYQNEGYNARVEDVEVSACPYEVGGEEHTLWVGGWITADSRFRQLAGTYGEPDERWAEEAERFAVELRPDPCQEVEDNLAAMAREDAKAQICSAFGVAYVVDDNGGFVAVGGVRDLILRITPDLDRFNANMAQISKAFERFAASMNVGLTAFGQLGAAFAVYKEQEKAREAALAAVPARKKQARACPRHGETLVGGGCRRCQREQIRSSNRSRR